MGEALLEIAKECECKISKKVLNDIMSFWKEGIEIQTEQKSWETLAEDEFTIQAPKILGDILNIFVKIKQDLKFNEEIRKEYRNKISIRSSEWIRLLRCVSQEIQKKTDGKLPIIIFEDLDKLNPEDAWKVFYNYAAILSGMSFPVIYTFPIGLSYDTRFSAIESYFIAKTLPMIKIETIEGQLFEDGINIIRKIVEKRASLNLFEINVLEKLIENTGGSLRDLFHAINSSAKRADRRNSNTISMEDAERAIQELKTSLTRRIEKKDYSFLLNIYHGNKELIEDKLDKNQKDFLTAKP